MSAGGHVSVLLTEAVEALAIKPDGVYVDATFGRGGHSREILARLGPVGRLIALDRDLTAVAAGQVLNDPRFVLRHAAFSEIGAVLAELQTGACGLQRVRRSAGQAGHRAGGWRADGYRRVVAAVGRGSARF